MGGCSPHIAVTHLLSPATNQFWQLKLRKPLWILAGVFLSLERYHPPSFNMLHRVNQKANSAYFLIALFLAVVFCQSWACCGLNSISSNFLFWKGTGFNTQHYHYCFALVDDCQVIFSCETSKALKEHPTNDIICSFAGSIWLERRCPDTAHDYILLYLHCAILEVFKIQL